MMEEMPLINEHVETEKEISSFTLWIRQLAAMCYKNFYFMVIFKIILKIRSWKITMFLILAPFLFVSFLVIIDTVPKSVEDNPYNPIPPIYSPKTKDLVPYQKCQSFKNNSCVSIRYAVSKGNNVDRNLLDNILKHIQERANLDRSDFREHSSHFELIDFIEKNPNTTTNALHFNVINQTHVEYTVLFNSSYSLVRVMMPDKFPDYRNEVNNYLF